MVVSQSLKKWGNGTGVRLPKKILKAANIQVDQELEISIKGRSIILTPIKQPNTITLRQLLGSVTPEQVGGELDWGEDVGSEIVD